MASKKFDKLLEDISMIMTDPSQASDDDRVENIIDRVRKLKPNKTPDQLRLAACHFMTMYHTRKAMTLGAGDGANGGGGGGGMTMTSMDANGQEQQQLDMDKLQEFKESQREDMELGWEFLQLRSTQPTTIKTARVLKIEVAQRLEDSVKLRLAYDDIIKRSLTREEQMVAFTAAPFVGDYKKMIELGISIESIPGGMEQLHMMSMQLPIPDFTLVYQLAKKHEMGNNDLPSPNDLIWDLISVESIRVRFKDVTCGEFEDKRQELLEQIHKQGETDWEDVPTVDHVHIKRMGALTQAVSFGELPIMLNGPTFDDRINVMGRAEMPMMGDADPAMQQMQMQQAMMGMGGGMENMVILVQSEEWDLKVDPTNDCQFIGTYTLEQRPMLPPTKTVTSEHAPVNMTFDCQILLAHSLASTSASSNNSHNNNEEFKSDDFDDNNDDNDNDETLVTEFDGLELD